MPEQGELVSIGQKVRQPRRRSLLFKGTAVLVLVAFAALVLHGNGLLALLLVGGGLGLWRLTVLEQLHQRQKLMLHDVDTMSDEGFRAYTADLLRVQGYGMLSAPPREDDPRDLQVLYGNERYICRLVRHSRQLGKPELMRILAEMKLYGGRRPMIVTNRTVSFLAARFAYRVRCLLIDRQVLSHLIVQYRQGHRVYTFHREETPKLRKRH
jgi:hypothetical protein